MKALKRMMSKGVLSFLSIWWYYKLLKYIRSSPYTEYYAHFFLGVLEDMFIGRDVKLSSRTKHAGPEIPSPEPVSWRPETLRDPAFEASEVQEVTMTTFYNREDLEPQLPGWVKTLGQFAKRNLE